MRTIVHIYIDHIVFRFTNSKTVRNSSALRREVVESALQLNESRKFVFIPSRYWKVLWKSERKQNVQNK